MNNPFGLPDELFTAIIKTAVNQQTKGKPENPFENIPKPDIGAMAERAATMAKTYREAFMKAGFNENEAFELTKGIFAAKR